MKSITTIAAIAVGLACAFNANAALVTYSVAGSPINNVGGDNVALGAVGPIVINPTVNGPAVTSALNSVDWTVNNLAAGTASGTLTRQITVAVAAPEGPAGGVDTLSQTVTLTITRSGNSEHQGLTINSNAPSVDFAWVNGGISYNLNISALALALNWNGNVNLLPKHVLGTIQGDFTLTATPVPEPTTLIGGALLALPFGINLLRKRRSTMGL